MNILVTGGQGFIGSHLIRHLLEREHKVTLLDRHFSEAAYPCAIRLGDLKDRDSVFEAVNQTDAWINLAGLLGTSEMVENPIPALEVNVLGALHVFDAARTFKKRGIQIAVGNHWMNNPYSITKSTAERFALMYNKEHGTDIRVVRAMNVFGEGQKHTPVRKIFPNFAIPALLDRPLTIYGSGEQIMDLIYVRDVADVLFRALVTDHVNVMEPFNVGLGGDLTVNEIGEMVIDAADSKSEVIHVPMRPGEEEAATVQATPADSERLWEELKFASEWSLARSIPQVVSWYREHLPEFPWSE